MPFLTRHPILPVLGCPCCLQAVTQTGGGTPEDPYCATAHNGADGTLCDGTGDEWTVTA